MFALCRTSSPLLRCTLNSSKMLPLEPTSGCINSSHIFSSHDYLSSQEKVSVNNHCIFSKRILHTSAVNKDMENAIRAVGAGISAIGIGVPGIGLGYVMGSLCQAAARNPSLKNQLFTYGIMGAAFCEALGLFAFVIAMMCLYA